MNLNEYEGSFLFKSPFSSRRPMHHSFIPGENEALFSPVYTQHSKTGNVYIFVIATIQSFTSQVFGVVGPLRENLDLLSPLGFDLQTDSDNKNPKNQALLSQSFKTLSK